MNIYPLRFLQPLRLKRWQYYAINTPTHFFSFTISHVGYLGLVFAYVVNYERKVYHEETVNIPFGAGIHLPKDSKSGKAFFQKGELLVSFENLDDRNRKINVIWPKFGSKTLVADLSISIPENQESCVNVFPFEGKRFFYTRKVNCMQVEGTIECEKKFVIDPGNSFGTLDWGVGVWPYNSEWIWGSFSTMLSDGRTIGINLGDKIGNNPHVTDNAIILDGKLNKIGKVDFAYDPSHLENEWEINSQDSSLNLSFKPFLVRLAKTDLKVISSFLHQVFGYYSGTLKSESGELIKIENVLGWIEEHKAKW